MQDAKIMSWWDYGYQITAMANRTILVDNNTWNNTHISRVGQAMASPEDKAYEIMQELDVSYVLVIFGGLTGYSSDGEYSLSLCHSLSTSPRPGHGLHYHAIHVGERESNLGGKGEIGLEKIYLGINTGNTFSVGFYSLYK